MRPGHGKASFTLSTYVHPLPGADQAAAPRADVGRTRKLLAPWVPIRDFWRSPQMDPFSGVSVAQFEKFGSGGEGGIRTLERPMAPLTYRLYIAGDAGIAVHAADDCLRLP
jgi:hypothetical protein